jgi:signal transduction histidine kinase/CheY-like chemotaxis protein
MFARALLFLSLVPFSVLFPAPAPTAPAPTVAALATTATAATAAAVFEGWPLVDNLAARDARLGGAVWSVAEAPDGEIIVGTNRLMVFDGTEWSEIGLAPGYAFRALAVEPDGRVWVGGTSQLGFLAKNPDGRWQFTSLLAEARAAGFSAPEEIWHAAVTEQGIVFVATQQVLRWDGGKFGVWDLPCAPRLLAHTVAGRLFIHQPESGLLRMDADGPVVVRTAGHLPEGLLLWIVAIAGDGTDDANSTGGDAGIGDTNVAVAGTGTGTGGSNSAKGANDTNGASTIAADAIAAGGDGDWIVGTNSGVFRLAAAGAATTAGDAGDAVAGAATATAVTTTTTATAASAATAAAGIARLPALSHALARQLPTCAVAFPDGSFAIGTYQSGIVLAGADGSVLDVLDRQAGLADDRVNRLFVDRRNRLWAGLSLGLARIDVTRQAALFDRRSGLGDGPISRVFMHGGERFVGTSRTIYRLAPARQPGDTARLEPLPSLNTFIWDTATIGDEIIAAGFGGIWRMSSPPQEPGGGGGPLSRGWGRQVWIHEHHVSADVFRVIASRYLADTVFFFEGHALRALQRTERDWVPRLLVQDAGDTPVSLIEDEGGDVWVSLMLSGVRRYRINDDVDGLPLTLRLVQSFEPGRGLPAGTIRPRLSLLGERVVAFTESAVLAVNANDAGAASFSPVAGLADWVGLAAAGAEGGTEAAGTTGAAGAAGAVGEAEGAGRAGGGHGAWWIVRDRKLGRFGVPALFHVTVDADSGAIQAGPAKAPGLDDLDSITSMDSADESGRPSLWIGGATRLLRIKPVPAGPPPGIRMQRVSAGGRPLPFSPDDSVPQLSPDNDSLDFRVFSPAAEEPVLFQTWLQGAEADWSPPQREPERSFVGLASGRYAFHARAVDRWGRAGAGLAHPFVILTPWFKTPLAIAAYVVAALLLIALGVCWRLRQLHRRAGELNRIIGERTRELAAANSAKTEFLERISHEIRNPLNGIIGLVAMLRELALGEREQDLVRSLRACSKSLARVFDDVLKFARLEHGQVTLVEKPFSLGALVAEVAALFRVPARQRGSEITIRREGDPPDHFIGDAEKIETILSNFVGNALKYAPGSPVDILVQVHAAADAAAGADAAARRAAITINVTDRGPGIPPDEQELVFEKFARGSLAKRHHPSGAGLGLATCRALATLLGGHVAVESPTHLHGHGGSTFFLTLQLKCAPAASAGLRGAGGPPADDGETAAPASATTALIVEDHSVEQWNLSFDDPASSAAALIVEDQPYNQIVVRRIAEKLGFATDVARDAADALAHLARRSYQLVLLDWELPDMNGDAVARRIRARPGGAAVIIIGTTAHDREDLRRQAAGAGMDGFALKPFETETIAQLLREIRARRETPPPAAPADRLDLRVFRFVGYDDPAQARQSALLWLDLLDRETAALAAAVSARDAGAAARVAHRLKSHAGLINAVELRDLAERLQRAARETPPAPPGALHREIERAARALRDQLRAWLAALPPE